MNLILSAAYGPYGKEMTSISQEFLSLYAHRHDADLRIVWSDKAWCNTDKMQLIRTALEEYERIIWIDADVLIRPDCPSLFTLVPVDCWAAFDECSRYDPWNIHRTHTRMAEVCRMEKLSIPNTGGRHYNCGIQVIPKAAVRLYDPPNSTPPDRVDDYEQPLVNVRVHLQDIKRFDLPDAFNALMYSVAPKRAEDSCYLCHFAGPPTPEQRLLDMRRVATKWIEQYPAFYV